MNNPSFLSSSSSCETQQQCHTVPACKITSKTRTRLFEKNYFLCGSCWNLQNKPMLEIFFFCCGTMLLKCLLGMYGNIFCFFVCLSLTRPHKPGLLFLTISWIQNFTQHVKMKKKEKNSPQVLTILGTAGQDLSEEKIWVRQYISGRLSIPYYKEHVLGMNSPQ